MKGYVKWPDTVHNFHIKRKFSFQRCLTDLQGLKNSFLKCNIFRSKIDTTFFPMSQHRLEKNNVKKFCPLYRAWSCICENWNASKSEWKQSDFHNKIYTTDVSI